MVRFSLQVDSVAQSISHTLVHTFPHYGHTQTIFTSSEVVETGKQAEERKKFYSASHSKTEPWLQPIRYPTAANTISEKNNLTHTDMMILMDVMESELTVSNLISNVAVLCSNQTTLHSNEGLVIRGRQSKVNYRGLDSAICPLYIQQTSGKSIKSA